MLPRSNRPSESETIPVPHIGTKRDTDNIILMRINDQTVICPVLFHQKFRILIGRMIPIKPAIQFQDLVIEFHSPSHYRWRSSSPAICRHHTVNFYFYDESEPSLVIIARSIFIFTTSQNRHSSSFVMKKASLLSYLQSSKSISRCQSLNSDWTCRHLAASIHASLPSTLTPAGVRDAACAPAALGEHGLNLSGLLFRHRRDQLKKTILHLRQLLIHTHLS